MYKAIAREILDLIKEGEFPEGSRMPTEREFAERFDVSRVTVREAEVALETLGYIVIKPGFGAYVVSELPASFENLPEVSAFELTAARAMVEAEATALAATNIDKNGLDELRSLIGIMGAEEHKGSVAGEEAHQAFHLAIARIAGNPVIEHLIKMMWRMRSEIPHIADLHREICREDAAVRASEHRSIMEALESYDPDAARSTMQEHFHKLFETMEAEIENSTLEQLKRQIKGDRQRLMSTIQQ